MFVILTLKYWIGGQNKNLWPTIGHRNTDKIKKLICGSGNGAGRFHFFNLSTYLIRFSFNNPAFDGRWKHDWCGRDAVRRKPVNQRLQMFDIRNGNF